MGDFETLQKTRDNIKSFRKVVNGSVISDTEIAVAKLFDTFDLDFILLF